MKFGKQLVRTLHQKWGDAYLNYKALKRAIKTLLAAREGDNDQGLSPRSYRLKEEEQVVELVNSEGTKVNNHYLKILAECRAEYSQLERLVDQLQKQQNNGKDSISEVIEKFDELCGKLDQLRGFVFLNHLGFQKILKKIDKKLSLSLKVHMMAQIQQKGFYKSRALSNLIILAGCKAADLHGEPRRRDYLCAICLDLPTRPVVLSCAHPFCYNCLGNAAHLEHNQCPVCRKEQPLDPKQYDVNQILEDFIRNHFPNFKPNNQKKLLGISDKISPLRLLQEQQQQPKDEREEEIDVLQPFGSDDTNMGLADDGLSFEVDKVFSWDILGLEVDGKLTSPMDMNQILKSDSEKSLDFMFENDSMADPFNLPDISDDIDGIEMDLSDPSGLSVGGNGLVETDPSHSHSLPSLSDGNESLLQELSKQQQEDLLSKKEEEEEETLNNSNVFSNHSILTKPTKPTTAASSSSASVPLISTGIITSHSSPVEMAMTSQVVVNHSLNTVCQQMQDMNAMQSAYHRGVQHPAVPLPKKLRIACVHCYKSKTACDGYRPCARCVRLKKINTCVDRQQKKRGRPRSNSSAGVTINSSGGGGGVKKQLRTQPPSQLQQHHHSSDSITDSPMTVALPPLSHIHYPQDSVITKTESPRTEIPSTQLLQQPLPVPPPVSVVDSNHPSGSSSSSSYGKLEDLIAKRKNLIALRHMYMEQLKQFEEEHLQYQLSAMTSCSGSGYDQFPAIY